MTPQGGGPVHGFFCGRFLLASAVAMLAVMGAGCASQPDEAEESGVPPAPPSMSSAERAAVAAYCKCEEEEAETVLIIDITIDEATDQRFTFPVRKEPVYDAEGLKIYRPRESRMGFGDSFSPRSWCNGGVNFDNGSDTDVTVRVDYDWMTARGVEGSVHEKVTACVSQPLERRLSDHAFVKAFWRSPWPPAAEETIPFFVGELGGREYNAAGWRLVGMGRAAIPALKKALTAGNNQGRGVAAWALGRIGLSEDGAREALIEALRTDASPYVRSSAAHALGQVEPSEDSLAALSDALQDADNDVRASARYALEHPEWKNADEPPNP
jgi:hypothetical protein